MSKHYKIEVSWRTYAHWQKIIEGNNLNAKKGIAKQEAMQKTLIWVNIQLNDLF